MTVVIASSCQKASQHEIAAVGMEIGPATLVAMASHAALACAAAGLLAAESVKAHLQFLVRKLTPLCLVHTFIHVRDVPRLACLLVGSVIYNVNLTGCFSSHRFFFFFLVKDAGIERGEVTILRYLFGVTAGPALTISSYFDVSYISIRVNASGGWVVCQMTGVPIL